MDLLTFHELYIIIEWNNYKGVVCLAAESFDFSQKKDILRFRRFSPFASREITASNFAEDIDNHNLKGNCK